MAKKMKTTTRIVVEAEPIVAENFVKRADVYNVTCPFDDEDGSCILDRADTKDEGVSVLLVHLNREHKGEAAWGVR